MDDVRPTATERVLAIRELLEAIFDQVNRSDALGVFQTCIQVCREWKYLAQPRFYQRVGRATPDLLYALLPTGVALDVEQGNTPEPNEPSLRLQTFAANARGLSVGYSGEALQTAYILNAMHRWGLTFPHLCDLRLRLQGAPLFPTVSRLALCELKRLDLSVLGWDHAVRTAIIAWPDEFRKVETFLLDAPVDSVMEIARLLLPRLPALTTLDMRALRLTAVPVLGQLLESTRCSALRIVSSEGPPSEPPSPAWPELRRLQIGICDLHTAVATLACFIASPLVSVTILIEADDDGTGHSWDPLVLNAATGHPLTEFYLSAVITKKMARMELGSALLPLQNCPSMHSFGIAVAVIDQDDAPSLELAYLEPLVRAWPNLHEFWVHVPDALERGRQATAAVDLALLGVLCEHCPALSRLELVVCGPTLLPDVVPGDTRLCVKVRILRHSNCQLDYPAISAVVHARWPHASVVSYPLRPLPDNRPWTAEEWRANPVWNPCWYLAQMESWGEELGFNPSWNAAQIAWCTAVLRVSTEDH